MSPRRDFLQPVARDRRCRPIVREHHRRDRTYPDSSRDANRWRRAAHLRRPQHPGIGRVLVYRNLRIRDLPPGWVETGCRPVHPSRELSAAWSAAAATGGLQYAGESRRGSTSVGPKPTSPKMTIPVERESRKVGLARTPWGAGVDGTLLKRGSKPAPSRTELFRRSHRGRYGHCLDGAASFSTSTRSCVPSQPPCQGGGSPQYRHRVDRAVAVFGAV